VSLKGLPPPPPGLELPSVGRVSWYSPAWEGGREGGGVREEAAAAACDIEGRVCVCTHAPTARWRNWLASMRRLSPAVARPPVFELESWPRREKGQR
jgi:hypothetical protein